MFDLSLCPICGVQYGGNLHNVPQQGGPPPSPTSSYKRQKHNSSFVILPLREFFEIQSLAFHWFIISILTYDFFEQIFATFKVFSCQIYHLVKKFPAHCPEIFSWTNIEFQQSPLFTAVGAEGGGGGGGLELKRLRAFGAFNTNIFHKLG